MHTNTPREDPLVDMGYEGRDVNYRNLGKAVVYFFVFTIASFAIGYLVFAVMNPLENRQTQLSNASPARRIPEAPNPLLQNNVTAKTDMMILRRIEDARIKSAGPVEGAPGKAFIPVDTAIDIIAERGLTAVGEGIPAVTRGNTTDEIQQPSDPTNTPSPAQVQAAQTPGAAVPPAAR